MRYNLNVLARVAKKSLKYAIFLYILISIDIISFMEHASIMEDPYTKFLSYAKVLTIRSSNNIDLVQLYNLFIIIYIAIALILYDHEHSFENVCLRFNSQKYFLNKMAIVPIYFIVYFFLYFLLIYTFFKDIPFNISFYIDNIIYSIFLFVNLFTFINNKTLMKWLLIPIFILSEIFYNNYVSIMIIIILLVFNYKTFNLKELSNR